MVNDPTITNAFSALTMSSREIAELTGKRHRNVIRDIVLMIEAIEKDGSDLSHQAKSKGYVRHTDARGYTASIDLSRELTYTLVLGYDAARRLKVVTRWLQLEAAAAAPIASHDFYVPQTKAEALRLAADLTEQVEEQRQRLEVTEPKAEALDQMSAMNAEPMGVRDVGRHLEIGQTRVADLVVQWGWACRESNKLKPTHYGREQGYTVLTSRIFTNKITHEEHVVLDFKMTRKGINRMAVRLAQDARKKPRLIAEAQGAK